MQKRPAAPAVGPDHLQMGSSADDIVHDVLRHLFCTQGKLAEAATLNDWYHALAYTVRDRLMARWIKTTRTYLDEGCRTVVYLSAEYLLGPQLGNNLLSLGIRERVEEATRRLGLSLDEILEQEEEPGLGNGGLGRLAACYMDSLATLQVPAIGYGIRYEFGIFDQVIRDGWQVETTDKWLRFGYPWDVGSPEVRYEVKFGGHTETFHDEGGRLCVRWVPERVAIGTPFDTPVLGYGVDTANTLRLWRAEASESFHLSSFNDGDYYKAVEDKVISENITKVLYPADDKVAGKELRLKQQYFFVSCSLQDLLRIYRGQGGALAKLHEKFVIQLNDTHPAIGVAELMRLLVDVHRMEWDAAWAITSKTFAYTNHTLMPEALEKWPLALFRRVLPRHMEIIFEINRRFLEEVRHRFPGDVRRVQRMSLIEEGPQQQVRMANLACVASTAINGVAALHSDLLKTTVLRDFHEMWPERFTNVTNGVTPRRFVALANPGRSRLITDAVGEGWVRDLEKLRGLEALAKDRGFHEEWRRVSRANKERLATQVRDLLSIDMDPSMLFDVQVKRFHEYKRQQLNALHIITLYHRLKQGRARGVPRVFLFGGKASSAYFMAKLIIRLIHGVAEVVNADPALDGLLRVVFYPDFNVKNAQNIYPAADLSEQISTAGKEASGTGNMKFALNGALTIGTLDGANIEIRDAVGPENFFCFGLTAEEVVRRKAEGYRPRDLYEADWELREAIDSIASGLFSRGEGSLYAPLLRSLLDHDDWMVLADYASYVACQEQVAAAWRDPEQWTCMSILNTARTGHFSSDRSIRDYCRDIWHVAPVPLEIPPAGRPPISVVG